MSKISAAKALWCSISIVILTLFAGCASIPPTEYTGKLLEKKIVHVEHDYTYRVQLLAAGEPLAARLQFRGYDRQTVHELPLYEKVLVYASEGEVDRSRIRTEIVEDAVIEGAVTTRIQEVDTGPLAGETMVVNNWQVVLDENGVFVDHNEALLQLFDDLRLRRVVLRLEHPVLGIRELELTREVLLLSLGINMNIERTNKATQLQFSVEPRFVRAAGPGSGFALQVQATNSGEAEVSSVFGRIISRHDWLDGITFYHGNIAAGTSKVFSRQIQVPATVAPGVYFAELGTWEARGPEPSRNQILEVRVGSIELE